MNKSIPAALIIIAGIFAWKLASSASAAPQPQQWNLKTSDNPSGPLVNEQQMAADPDSPIVRIHASTDPESPPSSKKPPPWLGTVETIPGPLSPQDLERALSYVLPTIELEVGRLSQRVFDSTCAIDLAEEAAQMAEIELLKAREWKLRQGDYFIMREPPSYWKAPAGFRFETYRASKDGEMVSIGFIFDRKTTPRLIDATEYAIEMQNHMLREAARSFNSRDHEERRRLVEEFVKLGENGGRNHMPAEMQKIFPIQNHVDRKTLLMHTPRKD
jgi:hypothetical protein